jgi:hypothetical protein
MYKCPQNVTFSANRKRGMFVASRKPDKMPSSKRLSDEDFILIFDHFYSEKIKKHNEKAYEIMYKNCGWRLYTIDGGMCSHTA